MPLGSLVALVDRTSLTDGHDEVNLGVENATVDHIRLARCHVDAAWLTLELTVDAREADLLREVLLQWKGQRLSLGLVRNPQQCRRRLGDGTISRRSQARLYGEAY